MSIWTERRTIVVYALSILALAEIIDLTIVSVAIPDLMGALGANINEISLTMTSYIVAAAICIPLTGLVTAKFGMRRVALTSVVVFGIASVLCGMATDLHEMIIFRLIQGIGGACLPSLGQSYITENFNQKEQPKIIAVFTVCVVLGPVIGPVMGGYIVENINWRWIFYVNVPVCALGYVLVNIFMDNKPLKNIKIDYISFAFMALGIGCLEYFIDEGNTNNWFQSLEMICFFVIALIFIGFFIWRGLLGLSVVNFEIFKNKNFVLSCLTMFFFFMMLSGSLSFFSTLMQQKYGFPVDTAGYFQAPRGIAAIIGAPLYLALSKKIDSRKLMCFALLLTGFSTLWMAHLSNEPNLKLIFIIVVMQGFGMIGVFVLLMPITYIGVPEELSSDCSGIFNFFRNFSTSIGTSIASTTLSSMQQVSWHDMASHVSDHSRGFRYWAQHLTSMPEIQKIQIAGQIVNSSSGFLSFLDMFYMGGIALIGMCWVPFLLKRPDSNAKVTMGH